MHIVTGNVVTGENFFEERRPIVRKLEEMLQTTDVLIVGPRRTGKTSLIKEYLRLQEEADENFKSIFIDLESTKNLYDFYIRIIKEILRATRKWQLYLGRTEEFIKTFSNRISEIFGGKLDIGSFLGLPAETPLTFNFPKFEAKKIAELSQQLDDILKNIPTPLVIVLDEFPELIWQFGQELPVNERLQSRKEQTEYMLSGLRVLRQEHDGTKVKHKIIIAGSVNLANTLDHMQLSDRINDLPKLTIPNLVADQAVRLFKELADTENFQFTPEKIYESFITTQFGKTSPLYIQMFAQLLVQLNKIDRGKEIPFTAEDLKTCYKQLIMASSGQGPRYFKARIERYYSPQEQEAVKFILEILARNQFTSKTKTSEDECLAYARAKMSEPLTRPQEVDLLAKMIADDLISIDAERYYFDSQFLCNFWHYTYVGTGFLV
jgi:uncharacterized protein